MLLFHILMGVVMVLLSYRNRLEIMHYKTCQSTKIINYFIHFHLVNSFLCQTIGELYYASEYRRFFTTFMSVQMCNSISYHILEVTTNQLQTTHLTWLIHTSDEYLLKFDVNTHNQAGYCIVFKAENDHENNTTKYFQTPADKQYIEKPVKNFLECTYT